MAKNDKGDRSQKYGVFNALPAATKVTQNINIVGAEALPEPPRDDDLRPDFYGSTGLWNRVLRAENRNLEAFVARIIEGALRLSRDLLTDDRYPHFRLYDEVRSRNLVKVLDEIVIGRSPAAMLTEVEAACCLVGCFIHPFAMVPHPDWIKQLDDSDCSEGSAWADYLNNRPSLEHVRSWLKETQENAVGAVKCGQMSQSECIDAHLLRGFIQERCMGGCEKNDSNLYFWLTELACACDDCDEELFFAFQDNGRIVDWKMDLSLIGRSVYHDVEWLRRELAGFLRDDHNIALCGELLRFANILCFDANSTPEYFVQQLTCVDELDLLSWYPGYCSNFARWKFDGEGLALLEEGSSAGKARTLRFVDNECQHPVHEKVIRDCVERLEEEFNSLSRELGVQKNETDQAGLRRKWLPRKPQTVKFKADVRSAKGENGKDLYIYNPLKFELTKDEILHLLMGERLYGDPDLCLRELIQNALDALDVRKQRYESKFPGESRDFSTDPRVVVTWGREATTEQHTITVRDFGTGMSPETVEKYFAQIGKSYYRSSEFLRDQRKMADDGNYATPISQFGIGILSCFMIADRIRVRTKPSSSHGIKESDRDGGASNLRLLGVGSMFYFEGGGQEDDAGQSRLNEPGTEITLWLKHGIRVEHDGKWLDRLRYEFEYSDHRVEDADDSTEDIIEESLNEDRTIDPAYVIGKYFVWPKFPIEFPNLGPVRGTDDPAPRVSSDFHLRYLMPIPETPLLQMRERGEWKPPIPDSVQWDTFDWEDRPKDWAETTDKNATPTASRVRLVYPNSDRTSGRDFPPRQINEIELADLAACVASVCEPADGQVLVNGMHIPRLGLCELVADLRGILGVSVWFDFRGVASPPLSINRLSVVTSGDEWREAVEVMRGVVDRFMERLYEESRRQFSFETVDSAATFSGLTTPQILWQRKMNSAEDRIRVLPRSKETGWRNTIEKDFDWSFVKLILGHRVAAAPIFRTLRRTYKGGIPKLNSKTAEYVSPEVLKQLQQAYKELDQNKPSGDALDIFGKLAPFKDADELISGKSNPRNSLIVTRARDILRDLVTEGYPDVMLRNTEQTKKFVSAEHQTGSRKDKVAGPQDFLKAIGDCLSNGREFTPGKFARYELLAHVGALLNWHPGFEDRSYLRRTAPAIFSPHDMPPADSSEPTKGFVRYIAQYDIIFPFTTFLQGDLGRVLSRWREDEETMLDFDALLVFAALPFLLPEPENVPWETISKKAFGPVKKIRALIPNPELWFEPFSNWGNLHADQMNPDKNDYGIQNRCLSACWDIEQGRILFDRGVASRDRLDKSGRTKKEIYHEIQEKLPPQGFRPRK